MNEGNSWNKYNLRLHNSVSGRPSKSRIPATVHWAIVSGPKNDSFASLRANFVIFDGVFRLIFFSTTSSGCTRIDEREG